MHFAQKRHVASKQLTQNATLATASTHQRILYLSALPNEILLAILEDLDISSLLSLCNVGTRFQTLAYIILAKRLLNNQSCVRLFFEQESRWRFTVDLKLTSVNPYTGQFVFTPVKPTVLRVFNSAILRNPTLQKIELLGPDVESLKAQTNFLSLPKPLQIKTMGSYRRCFSLHHPSTRTTAFSLSYDVSPTPADVKATRTGERWLTPVAFECPLVFFYPQTNSTSKVLQWMNSKFARGVQLRSYVARGRKSSRAGRPPGAEKDDVQVKPIECRETIDTKSLD
ncbi:hypothetical protein BC938DRAFT_474402 [Jimgerdemannia flammicorona]|uniref:F-box domain-containing protein n=1 Tax=Jimgerdemannia flammicorona TaxID=994334 RepID=A0A433QZJ3_9FUNG|nr:hypothetical protein BC938DRAFT_474402 [Jimgerdemannia flammicorona]